MTEGSPSTSPSVAATSPAYVRRRQVARIGEAPRESIGNQQTGIGTDQFAQPIPIAAIESFDVKMKDLFVLGR